MQYNNLKKLSETSLSGKFTTLSGSKMLLIGL